MMDKEFLEWSRFCEQNPFLSDKLEKFREILSDDERKYASYLSYDLLVHRIDELSKNYFEGKLSEKDMLYGNDDCLLLAEEFYGDLRLDQLRKNDPVYRALTARAMSGEEFSELKGRFEQLATDEAMLKLATGKTEDEIEAERLKIQSELNHYRNILFSMILVSCSWDENIEPIVTEIMESQLIDQYTKAMIVSAITLSGCATFRQGIFSMLISLYKNNASSVIRQRAFVGFIFMLVLNPDSLIAEACVKEYFEELLEDKKTLVAIIDLQRQMRLCLTSEKDGKDIMHSMILGLSNKIFADLDAKLKSTSGSFCKKDLEDIIDSEQKYRFDKIIRNMQDSEESGVDVNYRQFQKMKSFGHFHSLFNWFMPFYLGNSSLRNIRSKINEHRLFYTRLMQATCLCDNDFYSLVLSLNHASQNFKNLIEISNVGTGQDDIDLDCLPSEEETLVRHRYVQDLYRFYTLSPMRNSFANPFEVQNEEPFLTRGCFKSAKYDQIRLSLARFSAKRGDFSFVNKILRLVKNPTNEEKVMLGLSYFEDGDYEYAISYALDLLDEKPDDKHMLELCIKSYEALGGPEAIDYIDEILSIETDADKKLSYNLKKIDLLFNMHEYEKALALAYQMDNEHPGMEHVECRMAFCMMFVKPRNVKNVKRAFDLIKPYVDYGNGEILNLVKADFHKLSASDINDMLLKSVVTIVNRASKTGEAAWRIRKAFYYILCAAVLYDGNQLVKMVMDTEPMAIYKRLKSRHNDKYLVEWLRDFKILDAKISILAVKIKQLLNDVRQ